MPPTNLYSALYFAPSVSTTLYSPKYKPVNTSSSPAPNGTIFLYPLGPVIVNSNLGNGEADLLTLLVGLACGFFILLLNSFLIISFRSEERRVGKECRSRW